MIKNYNQFNESLRDKMLPKSNSDIDEVFFKRYKKEIDFINQCHEYIKNLPKFFTNISEPEITNNEGYDDDSEGDDYEENFFYSFTFDSKQTDTEYLLECLLIRKSYNLIDLTNGIDGHFYNFSDFKSILEEWEDFPKKI